MAMQISPALHCIDMAKNPADTVFHSPEGRWAQATAPDSSSSELKETGSGHDWMRAERPGVTIFHPDDSFVARRRRRCRFDQNVT